MNINDQYTNRLTDRFLTSSDYLSLQNITLGYTLPKSLTRKCRLTVSVYSLLQIMWLC